MCHFIFYFFFFFLMPVLLQFTCEAFKWIVRIDSVRALCHRDFIFSPLDVAGKNLVLGHMK